MAFNLTADFTRAARTDTFKYLDEYLNGTFTKRFCLAVPSTGASEKHEWLGQMPGVKEFLDTRAMENLKSFNFTIVNKVWEDTLAFTMDELNDTPALVKTRIPMLAASAAEHLDELLFSVLVAGTSGLCFDGKAMFATDHPTEDGGTFSNLLTGAGTTLAQVQSDWLEFEGAFLGIKKRNGAPLFRSLGKPTILHAPAMSAVLRECFLLPTASTGAPNPYYGLANLQVLGDLTGNDWYIMIEDKPMKPFIHQEREGWTFEWDETQRFLLNKIYYGGKARYNIGYGHPALCFMVNNS